MRDLLEKEERERGEAWLSIGMIEATMRLMCCHNVNRLDALLLVKEHAGHLSGAIDGLIEIEEEKDERKSIRGIDVRA